MNKFINIIIVSVTTLILFYLFCIHFTDSYHVAICRNPVSGKIWLDSTGGVTVTAPWTRVAKIDIRPIKVCINSSSRTINCRLVSFEPKGFNEFIKTEGFRYYWWDNRMSYNSGYKEEYRGLKDLLRGYTFDEKEKSFIKITKKIQ